MYTQEQTRELILKLKAVKEERGLTHQDVLDLVEANNDSTSMSSVRRVFAEDSENHSFNFRATLQPISKALLAIAQKENVANVDDNILQVQLDALKVESQLKDSIINNLQKELDEEKRKVAFLLSQNERQGKMLDKLLG